MSELKVQVFLSAHSGTFTAMRWLILDLYENNTRKDRL